MRGLDEVCCGEDGFAKSGCRRAYDAPEVGVGEQGELVGNGEGALDFARHREELVDLSREQGKSGRARLK